MTHHWLYLLHFDQPYHHARHYLGQTEILRRRLQQHADGQGARLTQVLWEQDLHWSLSGLFVSNDHAATVRTIERLTKDQHGLDKYCPLCNPTTYQTPSGTSEYSVSLIPFPTTSQELRSPKT